MGEKDKPSDKFSDEELERIANQGKTKEGKGNLASEAAREAFGDDRLTDDKGNIK